MSGGCNDSAKSHFWIAARSIVSFRNGHLFRNAVKSLIGSLIGLAITYMPASAEMTVDMMEGTKGPSSIAITDFLSDDETGSSMAAVIAADLEGSGLFLTIDKDAFIEKVSNPDTMPRFADWTAINARALVTGRVTNQPDGRLQTEFRLWDTLAGQQLDGQRLIVTAAEWRRAAHSIADAIYQRLTGEKGYFDSRIVFIDETGTAKKPVTRLAIMDQDGANVRYLTDGTYLTSTPRFSPTRQEIAYMLFDGKRPQTHLLQTDTGQSELVGKSTDMTMAPFFSSDGKRIGVSLLEGKGSANLYSIDLGSRVATQLTGTGEIDMGGSYSPDNSMIVFASNRSGQRGIYKMASDGSRVQRISFGDGAYSMPVWSPRGDWIAFTKRMGNDLAIGIMKTDGTGERMLTSGFHDNGPTWAPNGRVLMFSRTADGANNSHLFTVDITGRNLRQIVTPNRASCPTWSPILE